MWNTSCVRLLCWHAPRQISDVIYGACSMLPALRKLRCFHRHIMHAVLVPAQQGLNKPDTMVPCEQLQQLSALLTLVSSLGLSRTKWNRPDCSSLSRRSFAVQPRLPRMRTQILPTSVVRSSCSITSDPM